MDLPDPAASPAPEARLRSGLWFAAHLVVGGGVGMAILVILPMALAFVVAQIVVAVDAMPEVRLGPLDEQDTGWLSLIGLGLLALLGYTVAGLGRLATRMAPVLLGPSLVERIAALEAETSELTARNRLARELHDSVGHALTITTLQAAAAREVLDSDPEFVRRSLAAVEETGRAALIELDHMLGLLRQDEPSSRRPMPSLSDVEQMVADARAAGHGVTASITGLLPEVPPVVAREGYRIVQEGLTNAARHAWGAPVSVQLAAAKDALTIEIVNPLPAGSRPGDHDREPALEPGDQGRGRGLAGMRERVALLGGRCQAGREPAPDEPTGAWIWRVAVRLPLAGHRTKEAS